ncbi:MAG: glycerol-3-phosphate 1-O-acyltransferase PlsY [Metamycoplasmataceae bacterium]
MNILANIIWLVLGYFVGSVNFSIMLTRNSEKRRIITEIGSGNPGATNALRNYGPKFGLLIFLLDVSKSYWFVFIGIVLLKYVPFFDELYVQMMSVSVIIGHVFPIFFKFKGGKGAATNLGIISSVSILLAVIGFIIFFSFFFATRYVSLGAFITPFILAPLSLIPQLNGWYTSYLHGTFVDGSGAYYWLSFVTLLVAAFFVLFSHWQNVKRLLNGAETKTYLRSKTKQV